MTPVDETSTESEEMDEPAQLNGDLLRDMKVKVSDRKAERFYDRVRAQMQSRIEEKGGALDKVKDFLLFVPDIFMLLVRLAKDSRVTGKNRLLLGSGIAYYIFPLDIVPDLLPIGFLDDLVFGVYIINRMLADTDEAILREHWSGKEDLLTVIKKVLGAADNLVSSDFVGQIKKIVK